MICPSIAKVVEMIFSIDHVTKHIKSYYFIIVLSTTQYFLIYPASPTSRIILTNTPDWETLETFMNIIKDKQLKL